MSRDVVTGEDARAHYGTLVLERDLLSRNGLNTADVVLSCYVRDGRDVHLHRLVRNHLGAVVRDENERPVHEVLDIVLDVYP